MFEPQVQGGASEAFDSVEFSVDGRHDATLTRPQHRTALAPAAVDVRHDPRLSLGQDFTLFFIRDIDKCPDS